MDEKSLLSYFTEMKDPRVERTRYHLLDDIIFISIASVLSGAESWNGIKCNKAIKLVGLHGPT